MAAIIPKATQITLKRALGLMICDFKPKSTIFIDCKGRNLGRNGTLELISMFQRLDGPQPVMPVKKKKKIVGKPSEVRIASNIWVLNLAKLGPSAWQPACSAGTRRTLQHILKSSEHTKVLWNLDAQAEALWVLRGVKLGMPVVDLEIMEKMVRQPDENPWRKLSLDNALAEKSGIAPDQLLKWRAVQAEGARIFDPATNEGVDAFQIPRLPREIIEYGANGVRHLPALYLKLRAAMTDEQFELAKAQTVERVREIIEAAGPPVSDVNEIERTRVIDKEKKQKQLKREANKRKKDEKKKAKNPVKATEAMLKEQTAKKALRDILSLNHMF